MVSMLFKNTLIKIRKSFGRYLSLFVIALVGAGFFAGIQATAPDIAAAVGRYYDGHALMDYKVVGSMGLTDADTAALEALDAVEKAVPSYSLDVLDQDKAIRVHAIEKSANTVKLVEGRMPQSGNECAADGRNYKLGDRVKVTGDVGGKLKNTEFTVVGTVESVLYLADDYGNTTVGDGKLASFIFVGKEQFTLEAYTEIYLAAAGAADAAPYSDAYDDAAARLHAALLELKPDREAARYGEIYDEANGEIRKNEEKLNAEKAKGEKELAAAKAGLDQNAKKLRDAKAALLKSEAELRQAAEKQNAQFRSARAEIAKGRTELDAALAQSGLEQNQLDAKLGELSAAVASMQAQLGGLPAQSPEYAQLEAALRQAEASYGELLRLRESIDALAEGEAELDRGVEAFGAETARAKDEIEKGKRELAANEKKLTAGYAEYNGNLEKFNTEMAGARAKLEDAKKELAAIGRPKWHIFDREAAVGYDELKAALDVVSSVAAIFPCLFILLGALMTSNSMARMIAEERGELGTLASLGYGDAGIVFTYLFYVLSASGIGAAAGFFAGCRIIPPLIYRNFRFILPPLEIRYDPVTFLLILAVTLTLMTLVTAVSCNRELKQKPAALMRPAPPARGQTILLEKIGPVWKRLSFTWKVTMRNMFRYKKRAFMTLVGVTLCTSFLLVGFGLRDSMDGVAQKQYGEIFRYGNMIILQDETRTMSGELEDLLEKEGIRDPLPVKQTSLTCESADDSLDAFLTVPEDKEVFYRYYHLTAADDVALALNGGAVITQKLSEVMKAEKGDVLTVKDADDRVFRIPVAAVAENYTANYIYMDSALYEKIFGEPAAYNAVVSDHDGDEKALAERLIGSGLVLNVVFARDVMQKALDQNESLDAIIALVVAVACILAVVVLYNLMSINISERTREIATLKVLGFYDGETNAYIYREAMILTLISIGLGLVLGIFLHRFLVDLIEGYAVFIKRIKWPSFVLAALLTAAFSAVMQAVTYFKLRGIDMVESLKSVE